MDSAGAGSSWRHWGTLAAALALVALSLTFESVWPTLAIRPTARLSPEAGILAVGLAAAARRSGRALSARARRWLAAGWAVLVLVRYLEITTRALYGRDVNLYWDLQLLPDVGAMFAYVAEPRVIGALSVTVAALPLLVYLPVRWAIGCMADAAVWPGPRRAVAAFGATAIALSFADVLAGRPGHARFTAPSPVLSLAGEIAELVRETSGRARRPLPPPADVRSNLSRVAGADVLLVFLESYGMTSWERPAFRDALDAPRARLAAAIATTGRLVVSGRVESTTFGGESWLAHISLLSGTEVRDPDLNRRLLVERRDTLVTTFARAGYRTLAVMPGLQAPWPEGRFYGFDRLYGAPDLGYEGPPFGWWDVTDQFVLARTRELAFGPSDTRPAFVFVPTITTHAPFAPVPPYQPDWARLLTRTPYDEEDLERAYAMTPDWTNLGPGYVRALSYAMDVLGGLLRLESGRDLVLIVVGDHQPPALVSGEGASWDVPVHVIAGRAGVLNRLRASGFVDGLGPPGVTLARMDSLTRLLLDAFGDEPETGGHQQ